MGMEHELKRQLARELCAILDGWSQHEAAALSHTHQSELSRLRRGDLRRFSVARLLRLISNCHYKIDVQLRAIPRPYGTPGMSPMATVARYDRYGSLATRSPDRPGPSAWPNEGV